MDFDEPLKGAPTGAREAIWLSSLVKGNLVEHTVHRCERLLEAVIVWHLTCYLVVGDTERLDQMKAHEL